MARPPRRFQRRSPFGGLRRHILIVCEGKVTEVGYFEACRLAFRNASVKVDIDRRDGAPRTLVQRAIRLRKEAEIRAVKRGDDFFRYDEVWCVFDVDDRPDLAPLRQEAEQNGISLAISNPCFELWALLHFQGHTSHIERQALTGLLRRRLPDYQKALPFERIHSGYAQAVQRAAALDRHWEDTEDPGGNPSTGVYRLTERIREGGREPA
jgi:hypothetical protein